jgi:hypothetical protein
MGSAWLLAAVIAAVIGGMGSFPGAVVGGLFLGLLQTFFQSYLPEGTLWRVDVAPTDAPLPSGLPYGEVPAGATQAAPASGAPSPLISGQTYYLVALRDVYQPVTRCLFVAP